MNEAKAARDAAMEQVATDASAAWRALAGIALHRVAVANEDLTTDDVWAELDARAIPRPTEPRALGPVMMNAASAGIIKATPSMRLSHRVVAHAGPKRIWRSLVVGEEPIPWPARVEPCPWDWCPKPKDHPGTEHHPFQASPEEVVAPPEPKGFPCGCHRTAEGRYDARCVRHTWSDVE